MMLDLRALMGNLPWLKLVIISVTLGANEIFLSVTIDKMIETAS
jgi:hypothetical protein